MVRKLLIITAAAAIVGFVGAANAGGTPDILGSTNLKPGQTLTNEDMSKVVGTLAAAGAAGAAAAGSNFASAATNLPRAGLSLELFPFPSGSANASGSSSGTAF